MNILTYLIYYLIGNQSKVNLRKEKMDNLEKNAIKIIDEIEKFAYSLNHEITSNEKSVLMTHIINFCVFSKKSKPDINKLKYRAYDEFAKFEKDYLKNKPSLEQFINVESYKKELGKWSNIKLEMNYKEKLQYNNYSEAITKWKNKLDESTINEKIFFKLSKEEKQIFENIKEIIRKFPDFKDKILTLTEFLIEERDYSL